MRRVHWPLGLKPQRVTPLGGPRSLGMTESVTGEVQTVAQPYGLLRYQLDFPPLKGQMAARFMGLLASLEDGANWVGVSCLNHAGPGFATMGIEKSSEPWSNGMPWSNGQNWAASRPLAETASAGAVGARTITIDISAWQGVMWPGFTFGFLHFGAYVAQEVEITGDIATVRFWPGLRAAVTDEEPVTLQPVIAARLQPGQWSGGQRVSRFTEGASITLIEVPDDVVRLYTE